MSLFLEVHVISNPWVVRTLLLIKNFTLACMSVLLLLLLFIMLMCIAFIVYYVLSYCLLFIVNCLCLLFVFIVYFIVLLLLYCVIVHCLFYYCFYYLPRKKLQLGRSHLVPNRLRPPLRISARCRSVCLCLPHRRLSSPRAPWHPFCPQTYICSASRGS